MCCTVHNNNKSFFLKIPFFKKKKQEEEKTCNFRTVFAFMRCVCLCDQLDHTPAVRLKTMGKNKPARPAAFRSNTRNIIKQGGQLLKASPSQVFPASMLLPE